jgi:hypothetical protein
MKFIGIGLDELVAHIFYMLVPHKRTQMENACRSTRLINFFEERFQDSLIPMAMQV